MAGTTTENNAFWIAWCWDRIPAGPEPGGPPWLFIVEEHARAYVAQLQARGITASVRGWTASVTEWRGASLIRVPTIPAPELSLTTVSSEKNSPDAARNGVASDNLLPPPNLE